MLLLLLAIAWFSIIAFLLSHAIRQYGYFEILRPHSELFQGSAPSLELILPARNESRNLPRCLDGLLAQDYPADRLQIVVVDDNSTDNTAALVQSYAASHAHITLMPAGPLPPGWAGKAHACWRGAQSAGDAEWLCFLDADTASEPALLRTAVRAAMVREVGLLSLSPFQELVGFWERLIMPAGFFLIAFTQDLRQTHDPAAKTANANGQFLLFNREVYESIGGFEAARGSVAEDSAMARAVKQAGYRIAMLGTEGLVRTRMYEELVPLWQGLSRQAGELLGSASAALFWAAGALLLGWAAIVLPAWAAFAVAHHGAQPKDVIALILSSSASLALLGTHIGAARYFRIPLVYGMLFPLSYTLGALILLNAARGRSGGKVRWKGREYGA